MVRYSSQGSDQAHLDDQVSRFRSHTLEAGPRTEANACALLSDSLADFRNDLLSKANTVLDRSSVVVCPLVAVGFDELHR